MSITPLMSALMGAGLWMVIVPSTFQPLSAAVTVTAALAAFVVDSSLPAVRSGVRRPSRSCGSSYSHKSRGVLSRGPAEPGQRPRPPALGGRRGTLAA